MGAEPPAALIRELIAPIRAAPRPVVLIDGRSGSGKTTLASALAGALAGALAAQLVRMDWLYPGWDGLAAASAHVNQFLLGGDPPRWRAWDWAADAPGDWHAVDPRRPLIVEGTGALSRANRPLASAAIWVDQPDDDLRRERALAREDGVAYAPHWDRWAAQEQRFITAESPQELADVTVENATWTIRRRPAA